MQIKNTPFKKSPTNRECLKWTVAYDSNSKKKELIKVSRCFIVKVVDEIQEAIVLVSPFQLLIDAQLLFSLAFNASIIKGIHSCWDLPGTNEQSAYKPHTPGETRFFCERPPSHRENWLPHNWDPGRLFSFDCLMTIWMKSPLQWESYLTGRRRCRSVS